MTAKRNFAGVNAGVDAGVRVFVDLIVTVSIGMTG